MRINNKELKNNLVFAPMAGVSDVGMRFLCSYYGADATFTEMLSAMAMEHNSSKNRLLTLTTDAEKIKVAQIFGKSPEIMAKIVNDESLEKFDAIDINMGCPAPKIIKNGEGSALMKNPLLASKIIKSCVNSSKKPVSVKMRLGFDKIVATDFAKMCEDSGASFITVHGRTQSQLFSGSVNYEEIAKVKSAVKIPVIGNGDVVDRESYLKMLGTGVDAVMVGRGAQGKPWIFSVLQGKELKINPYEVAKKHVEILRNYFDEKWLKLYMRKHFLWYLSGVKCASEQRVKIATSNDIEKSLAVLKSIFCDNDFENN